MAWGDPITPIAKPVFERIWQTSGKIIDWAKYKNKVLLANAKYHKKYWERHGQVKIYPWLMNEKISLESIYTTVQFLECLDIRYVGTASYLEELYRQNGRWWFTSNSERLDGLEVAKQEQYLMVLGEPGVGKSTFLRKLGLEAFKTDSRRSHHSRLPVLIELKGFQSQEVDLKAAIAKEFAISNYPDSTDFTNYMLDQGSLLILLDGLDEVPTQQLDLVIKHIENFVDQYSDNWFVASCRTAAYRSSFRRFKDVAIAEFNNSQIENFIDRWFYSERDQEAGTAKTFWNLLKKPEHEATKELAKTPLLLTFLCLNYNRSQTLPSNRSELYRSALNIILQEWAAEKRIKRDPIYDGLNPCLEEMLLAKIAYQGFEQDRLLVSEEEIIHQITTFFSDTLNAPTPLNGQAILQAIEIQQGILVKRAPNRYSFSHLTLQEYLSATYILGNQKVEEMIDLHLSDDRWREIFLLVSGLMGFAVTDLFQAIERKAQTYLNTNRLKALVRWADRSTYNSEGDDKGPAKRTAALYLVLALNLYLALPLANDRDIVDNIAHDIDLDLDLALDLDLDLDNALALALALNIFLDFDLDRTRARARARAHARAHIRSHDIAFACRFARVYSRKKIFVNVDFSTLINKVEILGNVESSHNKSKEIQQDFLMQMYQVWLDALDISLETAQLSKIEAKSLANYLNAQILMIACKNSAVRVSRQAWQQIEDRMVTVLPSTASPKL